MRRLRIELLLQVESIDVLDNYALMRMRTMKLSDVVNGIYEPLHGCHNLS